MYYKPSHGKLIPGFEDKFFMEEDAVGTIRSVRLGKITQPYVISQTKGPLVRLIDRNTNREARICVLKVYYELFGKRLKGWTEIDPATIVHDSRPKILK